MEPIGFTGITHHDDEVLTILLKLVDDISDLVQGESLRVEGLDPPLVHVVDVLESEHSLSGVLKQSLTIH
jgi:hypothetical protein